MRLLAIIAAARAGKEPSDAATDLACLLAVCAYVVVGMGLWAVQS